MSALWVIAMGAVGLAFGVTSGAGWTILAGLALLLPIFVLWVWSAPRQTRSEHRGRTPVTVDTR